MITAVPGASHYFKGGVVSYANEVKTNLLGVDAQVIEEQTPVCEEVARQMVKGALRVFDTDYAVSVTGFAGPGGVENGKNAVLVGTIWIAVGNSERIETVMLEEDKWPRQELGLCHFHGNAHAPRLPQGRPRYRRRSLSTPYYIYVCSPRNSALRIARRTSQSAHYTINNACDLTPLGKIIGEKFVR